jgi:diaminopimelate epimerase
VITQGWKIQGCKNSFVLCWCPHEKDIRHEELARFLCSPATGIGSDGLIMPLLPLVNDQSSTAHFDVCMLNPDGSNMGMCGNGVRCLVRFLVLEQHLPPETGTVHFTVNKRLIRCSYSDGGKLVEADMGEPEFSKENIPVLLEGDPLHTILDTPSGDSFSATILSMGNPHCVIEVENPDSFSVHETGRELENHSVFPERANIEFVQVLSPSKIKMRVWERGAGETQACGTGACAAAVAMYKRDRVGRCVEVLLPGGTLQVRWDESDNRVYLSGPALEVAKLVDINVPT